MRASGGGAGARLGVENDPIDWDGWRAAYDGLSFAEQQAFYGRVAEIYPVQRSFDLWSVQGAFDLIGGEGLSVVELGGWDGRLAGSMLARGDIREWTNFDLVAVPQACAHPGYRLEVLAAPFWDVPRSADVFVSCHTIEHLKARELELLFACLDVGWVYLEAPLGEGPTGWGGYPGSHVLEIGWDGIDGLLDDDGFERRAGTGSTGVWGSR